MDRWATFDCYGTLIDWNGGIGRELERLFGAEHAGASPERLSRARAGDPARAAVATYRERPHDRALPARRARRPAAGGGRAGRARAFAADVAAVPRGAGGARGCPRSRLEARDPLEHRPRLPRRVARADRRAVRRRRSSRPRSGRTNRRIAHWEAFDAARPERPGKRMSTSARVSSTTLRRPRSSACPRSGSTGSARTPNRSPTSSFTRSTGLGDALDSLVAS